MNMGPCNVIIGPCNLNRVPWIVIRGPSNAIMGRRNLNMWP